MPGQPAVQPERWPDLPVILLAGALLVAGGAVALTYGTGSRWIGHAVTAFTGLALMIAVILTGAVQKGRIRAIRIPGVYRFHRMAGIGFGLLVIGTFVLGILTTLRYGGHLFKFPHGIAGLVLVLLVVVQLASSLLARRRAGIQVLHRFTGYAIVLVYLLEVIIGLARAGLL